MATGLIVFGVLVGIGIIALIIRLGKKGEEL